MENKEIKMDVFFIKIFGVERRVIVFDDFMSIKKKDDKEIDYNFFDIY
jgi:hypothetical protein